MNASRDQAANPVPEGTVGSGVLAPDSHCPPQSCLSNPEFKEGARERT